MSNIAYLFNEGGIKYDENGKPVTDQYGRPVKFPPSPDIPFELRSWQPYGPTAAYNRYGLGIEVNYRFFCDPNERITMFEDKVIRLLYKDRVYQITWILEYETHYEVMVKYIEKYQEWEVPKFIGASFFILERKWQ